MKATAEECYSTLKKAGHFKNCTGDWELKVIADYGEAAATLRLSEVAAENERLKAMLEEMAGALVWTQNSFKSLLRGKRVVNADEVIANGDSILTKHEQLKIKS